MRNPCLIFLLLASWSCKTGEPALQQIENTVRSRFTSYELLFNESRSFVVAVEKNATNASGRLNYLIFNCTNGSQISEGSFRAGYIKWLNDNEVEIFDAPGMVHKDEHLDLYKKVISVKSAKY